MQVNGSAVAHDCPPHWRRGQLLDLKRFSDGTYRATLLGEEWKPELRNGIEFETTEDAQTFVSWWYSPPSVP